MDGDLISFLGHQFPESSFCGRLQVGCRGRRSYSIVPSLTCDYDCLLSSLSTFVFSPYADYYLSVNSVSGVRRCIASLFSLHNLVIDIDCHGSLSSLLLEPLIDCLLWRLEHSVFAVEVEPPTSVVRTGRGLQLWWGFEGMSAKFKPFYDELLEYYISSISQVLCEGSLEDFSMFTVDVGASKNAVGYFRMPTTWNSMAHMVATYTLGADTYDLMDLFHRMKGRLEETAEMSGDGIREKAPSFLLSGRDYVDLAHSRVNLYEQLRELRAYSMGCEERNNFCFMVYNAFVTCYGHEVAYGKIKQFNARFREPMLDSELNTVISTAKKKGGYYYSTKKMIEFLRITQDELTQLQVENYDFRYLSKKKQKVVQNLTKKDLRNETVLALYDAGNSAQSISKELGLSVPTVALVLKEHGRSHKFHRKTEILALVQAGKSTAEIAQICNCTVRTVQRAVRGTDVGEG